MGGKAFGKIILFGEHAVVHGTAALAAALDRGVRATAEDGPSEVHILAGERRTSATPNDGTDVGRAFARILEVLQRSAKVAVVFDVPIQMGLGSSAAFCVAVARALGASEAQVLEAGRAGEGVFHGRSSGVDLEVARRGGVGKFSLGSGWSDLEVAPFELCVGLSGKTRSTHTRVAHVTNLLEALPETGAQLLAGVRSVVQAAEVALKAGDLARLGALMNINHGLLSAMGVSTAELDQLCHLARGAGAVGAKLTGAGGGGAVLALAPGAEDQVLAAWQTAGYQSFRTRIPCAP